MTSWFICVHLCFKYSMWHDLNLSDTIVHFIISSTVISCDVASIAVACTCTGIRVRILLRHTHTHSRLWCTFFDPLWNGTHTHTPIVLQFYFIFNLNKIYVGFLNFYDWFESLWNCQFMDDIKTDMGWLICQQMSSRATFQRQSDEYETKPHFEIRNK